MNTQTKRWSFTWDTNVKQKTLPNEVKLMNFLNRETDLSCFQYELGEIKKKEHIQGMMTLAGERKSKRSVLELFKETFKNVDGLTIQPVYDTVALSAYVTKEEGRVKGPYFAGRKEMYNSKLANNSLRNWQKELFDTLITEQDEFKDRKVLWVEDMCGNTGKSWFQKWLRIGQKQLVVRQLPVSSVDRLISAVNIISRNIEVDVYTIDLTRTRGEGQSYEDLFAAVEQIKNGYVVDVMYGKYNEAIFNPPMIVIFTNQRIDDFYNYLSQDRWEEFSIGSTGKLNRRIELSPEAELEYDLGALERTKERQRLRKIRNKEKEK
jgi:hypothetical protein